MNKMDYRWVSSSVLPETKKRPLSIGVASLETRLAAANVNQELTGPRPQRGSRKMLMFGLQKVSP
jgi:hypothetical protein